MRRIDRNRREQQIEFPVAIVLYKRPCVLVQFVQPENADSLLRKLGSQLVIPALVLFGNKSMNHARTELIVFLTPHVIYDTNQIAEATDELKAKMKKLKRMITE